MRFLLLLVSFLGFYSNVLGYNTPVMRQIGSTILSLNCKLKNGSLKERFKIQVKTVEPWNSKVNTEVRSVLTIKTIADYQNFRGTELTVLNEKQGIYWYSWSASYFESDDASLVWSSDNRLEVRDGTSKIYFNDCF